MVPIFEKAPKVLMSFMKRKMIPNTLQNIQSMVTLMAIVISLPKRLIFKYCLLYFIKLLKVTNELNLLLKKLDSVLRKDALGLFSNIHSQVTLNSFFGWKYFVRAERRLRANDPRSLSFSMARLHVHVTWLTWKIAREQTTLPQFHNLGCELNTLKIIASRCCVYR